MTTMSLPTTPILRPPLGFYDRIASWVAPWGVSWSSTTSTTTRLRSAVGQGDAHGHGPDAGGRRAPASATAAAITARPDPADRQVVMAEVSHRRTSGPDG